MSRPRERSTTSSLVAVAAMLAGCSKGAAPSTAPAVDAGTEPAASDGAAPTALRWDCGEGVAVHIDRKDSAYPVAEALGSGWCRLPFAPEASRRRIAFRENMPVQMPAWGPCDGGTPGCQRIDAKAWTTYPVPFGVAVQADGAGVARIEFGQSFRQPFSVDVPWTGYSWAGVLDGEPDFVTFSADGDAQDAGDMLEYTASTAGVAIGVRPKGGDRCGRFILHAATPERDALRLLLGPIANCDADETGIGRVNVFDAMLSSTTLIMNGSAGADGATTLLDARTGRLTAPTVAGRAFRSGSSPYAAPGGAVTMLDAPPSYPLAFVDEATGEGTILVTPPGGRMLIPMGLDWSTTPPTLVWVEGDDQGTALTNVDVYASPFARTPEGITRRKVTHIPDHYWGAGAVNAGYYVTGTDDSNKNWIIRLSDGVRWPFVIGPERDVGAFWVTKDEIFYKTGDYAGWQASGLSESALAGFLDGLERASITALLATTPLPRIP